MALLLAPLVHQTTVYVVAKSRKTENNRILLVCQKGWKLLERNSHSRLFVDPATFPGCFVGVKAPRLSGKPSLSSPATVSLFLQLVCRGAVIEVTESPRKMCATTESKKGSCDLVACAEIVLLQAAPEPWGVYRVLTVGWDLADEGSPSDGGKDQAHFAVASALGFFGPRPTSPETASSSHVKVALDRVKHLRVLALAHQNSSGSEANEEGWQKKEVNLPSAPSNDLNEAEKKVARSNTEAPKAHALFRSSVELRRELQRVCAECRTKAAATLAGNATQQQQRGQAVAVNCQQRRKRRTSRAEWDAFRRALRRWGDDEDPSSSFAKEENSAAAGFECRQARPGEGGGAEGAASAVQDARPGPVVPSRGEGSASLWQAGSLKDGANNETGCRSAFAAAQNDPQTRFMVSWIRRLVASRRDLKSVPGKVLDSVGMDQGVKSVAVPTRATPSSANHAAPPATSPPPPPPHSPPSSPLLAVASTPATATSAKLSVVHLLGVESNACGKHGGQGLDCLLALVVASSVPRVRVTSASTSESALLAGRAAATTLGLKNLDFVLLDNLTRELLKTQVEDRPLTRIADQTQRVDVVFGLRCCGGLAEFALSLATEHAASFALSTCCFRANPHLALLTNPPRTTLASSSPISPPSSSSSPSFPSPSLSSLSSSSSSSTPPPLCAPSKIDLSESCDLALSPLCQSSSSSSSSSGGGGGGSDHPTHVSTEAKNSSTVAALSSSSGHFLSHDQATAQDQARSAAVHRKVKAAARKLYQGAVLAPMVRCGTLPLRSLCLGYGANAVWGEELIDHALAACSRVENAKLGTVDFLSPSRDGTSGAVLLRTCPTVEGGRFVCQLGTSSPEGALKAALVVHNDVAAIDINMGCPLPFSVKGGMGAALLEDQDNAVAIVTLLTARLRIPVSCKIRLLPLSAPSHKGVAVEEDGAFTAPTEAEAEANKAVSENASSLLAGVDAAATARFAARLVSAGCSAITLHCRLPSDRASAHVPARRGALRSVADAIAPTPLIANGDFYLSLSDFEHGNGEDCEKAKKVSHLVVNRYGCSGVMLARPALFNASSFTPLNREVLARLSERDAATVDATGEGTGEGTAKATAEATAEARNTHTGATDATDNAEPCAKDKGSGEVDRGQGGGMAPLLVVVEAFVRECIRFDAGYQNAKYTMMEMLQSRRHPKSLVSPSKAFQGATAHAAAAFPPPNYNAVAATAYSSDSPEYAPTEESSAGCDNEMVGGTNSSSNSSSNSSVGTSGLASWMQRVSSAQSMPDLAALVGIRHAEYANLKATAGRQSAESYLEEGRRGCGLCCPPNLGDGQTGLLPQPAVSSDPHGAEEATHGDRRAALTGSGANESYSAELSTEEGLQLSWAEVEDLRDLCVVADSDHSAQQFSAMEVVNRARLHVARGRFRRRWGPEQQKRQQQQEKGKEVKGRGGNEVSGGEEDAGTATGRLQLRVSQVAFSGSSSHRSRVLTGEVMEAPGGAV